MDDLISRLAAIDALRHWWDNPDDARSTRQVMESLPSAKPEVTEEAVKDYCRKRGLTILTNDYFHKLTSAEPDYQEVLGWLLAYHTQSFDLHGRYIPNEVIAWLINDFSKEFIAEGRWE